MKQTIAALIASAVIVTPAFADAPVQLRARIEADGPAVTLGDVFTNTGAASSRPIAPAPPAGQIGTLNMDFLVAAAQSANLAFSPPAGVSEVRIVHPAGMRATIAAPQLSMQSTPQSDVGAADLSSDQAPNQASAQTISAVGAAVRRGETVAVTYQIANLTLTARARAMTDGSVGQTIRLLNPQSNQMLEALITGPGSARINP